MNLKLFSLFLYLSSSLLILLFLSLPHYVELTGTLETWFLAKGLVYYKEFAAFHFPLGRLILLPIHLITNWNLETDPWVGLFLGAGTLYIIYLFGKRFLSPLGTGIALIFFSIFFWYAATGILFFHEILIGFILSLIIYLLFRLHVRKKVIYKDLFLLGLLVALTELSGQIATITLGIVVILVLYEITQKQTKNSIASIGVLTIGMALPFLLFSIYFLSKGSLGEFYHYNITYYLLYAGYERDSLLLLPIRELLAFYVPLITLSLVSLLSLLSRKKIDYQTVYALLLSASTIPFIILSIYHPHHLNYALPILAIAAAVAYDKSRDKNFIFGLGGFIVLLIVITSILPWYIERIKYPPNFRIANDLYPDSKDPMKDAVLWVAKNTTEDDKILVVGDPLFYLRSDRLPASRPSKGIPYAWNPLEDIKKEIREKPPNYWIVDKQFLEKLITNHNREDQVDFVNDELNYCYKMVVAYDHWEIWQKTCE